MKCPECGAESSVLETRGTRRRRQCRNGHRWSTDEVVADFRADMYERGQATRRANALQAEAGTANAYAGQFRAAQKTARHVAAARSGPDELAKALTDGRMDGKLSPTPTALLERAMRAAREQTPRAKTSAAALVRARLEAARCDRTDDDDY